MDPITIAVAGLGFGQDFVPIYLCHPDVGRVVLVEPDLDRRQSVANRFGLDCGYADIADALADDTIDAIHILAPVPTHADLAVSALDAGKHVACAVPMATTLEDLERVIAAQEGSGRNYMMMETTVYSREYQTIRELYRQDAFGPLTLYRGYHIQQLDGFPVYWQGFPPMHYITHALSPLLALLETRATAVRCRGAGTLSADRRSGGFDNPYPTEVGLFTLADSDVLADITMSFFQTARSYIEGLSLYGERLGVEWPIDNTGPLSVYEMSGPADGSRGNTVATREIDPQNDITGLTEELVRFVRPGEIRFPGTPAPVPTGAGHGGSHPFLVDEFVGSIVQQRKPMIDARTAARWTAPGICAHRSALDGGAEVQIPAY
jgi:predicted dehydrogenase